MRQIKKNLKLILAVLAVAAIAIVAWLYNTRNTAEYAEAAWWNESWQYRTKLTIDHSKIDADLTNFPVAIHLNGSRIAYSKAQSDGDDLRFTLPNGTELNYEVEKWDAAATSTIWVRLPDVEADIPTDFFMYYGNSSVGSAASSTLVWDENFKLVQHLEETDIDGGVDDVSDSTRYNNDGTTSGMNTSDAVAARIDGGFDFDGVSDQVNVGDVDVTTMTLSAWIYPRDYGSHANGLGRIFDKNIFTFELNNDYPELGTQNLLFYDTDEWEQSSNGSISLNQWQHVVVTVDSTTVTFYVNGQQAGSNTGAHTVGLDSNNVTIGSQSVAPTELEFNGIIDEAQISDITRSAAWIKADYNSGQDTLLSFGQEETGGGPVGYWSFDEGFGSTAYNMMNATGTDGAISGANWKSEEFCVSGKCLEFDGADDYVGLSEPPAVATDLSTGSVFAWIKTGNAGAIDRGIVVKQNAWGMYLFDNDFTVYSFGGSSAHRDTNVTLNDNEWHHVGFTFESGVSNGTKLYIDGEERLVTIITVNIQNEGLVFGAGNNPASIQQFKGFIDEVKVYPRILSVDEIRAEFAARGTSRGSSAVFGAYDQKFLSDGLVGYWPMNESAANSCTGGVNDSCDQSGLGNNGAWNGNTTATTTAKFGRGTEYDGTGDYINLADSSSLSPTFNLTLSAWVNPNASIASKSLVVKDSAYRLVTNSSGNPGCQIHNGSDWQTAATSTTALATDSWQQVVCTYDKENVRVYVNGNRTASEAVSAAINDSSDAVRLGDDAAGGFGDYNGRLDDVRIYNRALSPAEIKKLYAWAPGPVGHWTMDEKVSGDAKTIYNYAATSTDGLLNGTTVDGANNTGMDCAVRGKFGGACEFDGVDDYVNVSDSVALQPAGRSWSVALWAKPPNQNQVGPMVSKRQNGSPFEQFTLRIAGTDSHAWSVGKRVTFIYIEESGVTERSGFTNRDIADGNWHHIIMVADKVADTIRIYVDGTQESVTLDYTFGAWPTINNADDLRIGNNNSTNYFDGSIDDVQIFDYALSQKQITNIMNGRQVWASAVGSPVGSAVGHWSFEEGGGTTAFDSGSQNNNGTYTGNASSTPEAGKLGRGVELDGSGDYVSVTDSASISFASSNLSFSSWVKPTALSGNQAILAKNNEYRMVVNSSGNVGCQIHNGTDWQGAATSTAAIAAGSWEHAACTYDGSTLRVFIKGEARGSASIASVSNNTTNALRLGDDESAAFNEINGSLDEVKIYNYALSEDEIKLEFNQGKSAKLGSLSTESDGKTFTDSAEREYCIPGDTSTCRPPVGEWRMDEKVSGDAKTVRDTSNNANDGTTVDGANNTGMDCTVRGKVGGACQFDGGDDYVTGSKSVVVLPATMTAWVKRTNSTSFGVILSHDTNANDGYRIGINNTTLTFTLGGVADYDTGLTIPLNEWTFVAVTATANGGTRTGYVNGLASASAAIGTMSGIPTNFNIGRRGDGGDDTFFPGLIDHVRVYDYARTAGQVAWEYNRGGPVGWWKFDECSGTVAYDSGGIGGIGGIGNKNHGTITIGATGTNTEAGTCVSGNTAHAWNNGKTGKRNYSLDFDGTSDYVFISDANSLDDQNDAVTVSGWFKPANTMNSGTSFTQLVTKNDAGGADCSPEAWDLYYESGSLVLFFAGSPNFTNSFTTNLNANQWYHIVGTYDKQNIKLYLDGKLVKTVAETQGINSGNCDVVIGADEGGDAYFFDGQIDEVKVWNYALTPLQIKNEYNGGAVNFAPLTGAP